MPLGKLAAFRNRGPLVALMCLCVDNKFDDLYRILQRALHQRMQISGTLVPGYQFKVTINVRRRSGART